MRRIITKKTVGNHLSYDWVKYIAVVLLSVLLWMVLGTVLAPRIPVAKSFDFLVVTKSIKADELNSFATKLKNSLSSEILTVNNLHVSNGSSYYKTQLDSNFATQKCDMLLIDNAQKGETEETKNNISGFKKYVDGGIIYSLEDAVNEMFNLNFTAEYEKEFRSRLKKERRFNKVDTEEDIKEAIEAEKLRMQLLKKEAEKLSYYLGLKTDTSGEYKEIENLAYRYKKNQQLVEGENSTSTTVIEKEKIWGINVAEVGDKMVLKNISKLFSFTPVTEKTEDIRPTEYAMGLSLKSANLSVFYEGITAINLFIETYK